MARSGRRGLTPACLAVLAACGPTADDEWASPTDTASSGSCELELWPTSPHPEVPAECNPLLGEQDIPIIQVRVRNNLGYAVVLEHFPPCDWVGPLAAEEISGPGVSPTVDNCAGGVLGNTCTVACGSGVLYSHLRIAKGGVGTIAWGAVGVPDVLPSSCVHEDLADSCEDLACFRRIAAPPGAYSMTVLPTKASECRYDNEACTCEYDAYGACTHPVATLGEPTPVTVEVTVTETSWCDGIDLVLE